MKNHLEGLNPEQKKAVECTEGPVMIIAGAGSGKTRVLTHRIAHLITLGVDPFNILALTFTNKAARAMKERIVDIVGNDANNLWMGTFHSVFARILRIEAYKLNYPSNFTIYDTDDSKSLLKDVIKEQQLDDKIYKVDMVHNRISTAKNNLFSAKEYQENHEIQLDDKAAGKPKIGLLYEHYSLRCFKAGAMDFDDLLYKTFVLLSKFPEVLYKYQNKFKYILVDEYQDTNFAQYTIIKKLAARSENICVVGDDAQSIYSFRGADIQNILNFEKDYPDLQIFKLEQNYRSTQNIVNAANGVILNNRDQLKKEVWTQNEDGAKLSLLKAINDNEEGNMVASSILEEKLTERLDNKDFAILYRTNAQSRAIEEAMRKHGIPYRIYGGLSFYKRKEVKDLLAYFRLIINNNDEEALKRCINYPARGIGKTTLDRVIVEANQGEKTPWQVLETIESLKGLGGSTKGKIAEFVLMIKSFSVQQNTMNAYDIASKIAAASGCLKDLYADKTPEGVSRYENIQELLNGIKEFTEDKSIVFNPEDGEIVSGEKTLGMFMQDIALLTDADNDNPDDKNKVSIMTIHSAKGLEFNHVFVVGMEESLFPSQMSISTRAELEEERRLFYVAITRAEKKLTLSYAQSRYRWGTLHHFQPSRFLEEISPEFLNVEYRQKPLEDEFADITSQRSRFYSGNTKPVTSKPLQSTQDSADFIADDPTLIQVGMEVEHQRFGKGKVLAIEGIAPNAKATVFFQGQGQKQLLLKYARLKISK